MIGLVQLQLPVLVTKADLARQTDRIVYMVGKARRNLGTMELLIARSPHLQANRNVHPVRLYLFAYK